MNQYAFWLGILFNLAWALGLLLSLILLRKNRDSGKAKWLLAGFLSGLSFLALLSGWFPDFPMLPAQLLVFLKVSLLLSLPLLAFFYVQSGLTGNKRGISQGASFA
jgi:hypothetical protein